MTSIRETVRGLWYTMTDDDCRFRQYGPDTFADKVCEAIAPCVAQLRADLERAREQLYQESMAHRATSRERDAARAELAELGDSHTRIESRLIDTERQLATVLAERDARTREVERLTAAFDVWWHSEDDDRETELDGLIAARASVATPPPAARPELAERGLTIRFCQAKQPWTVPYALGLLAVVDKHINNGGIPHILATHCALHAAKSVGKLAAVFEALDHPDPSAPRLPVTNEPSQLGAAAPSAEQLATIKAMSADLVTAALRFANLYRFDLETTLDERVREKNGTGYADAPAAPPPAARPERGGECGLCTTDPTLQLHDHESVSAEGDCDNRDGATGTRCIREDGHRGYCDFGPRLPEPGHCEPATAPEGSRFDCDDCAVGRDCPEHDEPVPPAATRPHDPDSVGFAHMLGPRESAIALKFKPACPSCASTRETAPPATSAFVDEPDPVTGCYDCGHLLKCPAHADAAPQAAARAERGDECADELHEVRMVAYAHGFMAREPVHEWLDLRLRDRQRMIERRDPAPPAASAGAGVTHDEAEATIGTRLGWLPTKAAHDMLAYIAQQRAKDEAAAAREAKVRAMISDWRAAAKKRKASYLEHGREHDHGYSRALESVATSMERTIAEHPVSAARSRTL